MSEKYDYSNYIGNIMREFKRSKEDLLIDHINRIFEITGQFPSAYELAITMEVSIDLATRCINKARKQLYRGGTQ